MSNTVQLNVRMERSLRDAGNAALEYQNISPSVFVRAVWEKLAQRGQALEDAVELFLGEPERLNAGSDELSPVDQGQALYNTLLQDVGLDGANLQGLYDSWGHDDMRENALVERWCERGLDGK